MWPLVIGAGALWYLTRLRRNPDWITDAQGRHHPLRAGDGRAGDPTPYDPAKVGEKGPRRAVSPAAAPRAQAAKPRGLSGPAWHPLKGAREIWRHEYKGTDGAPTYRGIVYFYDTPDRYGRQYGAVYGYEVRPGVFAYIADDAGTSLADMQQRIKNGVAIGQRRTANEVARTTVDPAVARREKLFAEIDRVWDAVGRSDIVAIGPNKTHERTRQAIRRAIRENKVPMALRADVESKLMVMAEPYIINQIEVGVTPTRRARRR